MLLIYAGLIVNTDLCITLGLLPLCHMLLMLLKVTILLLMMILLALLFTCTGTARALPGQEDDEGRHQQLPRRAGKNLRHICPVTVIIISVQS